MEIKLSGETLEMNPSFLNLNKVEKQCGSIFSFGHRLRDGNVTFSDIVNVYYFMQADSNYNQEVIAKKIMKDGLAIHLTQVANMLGEILMGGESSAGKKEKAEPQK